MPVIRATQTIRDGCQVRIQISPGRPNLMQRRRAGRPIPAPVVVTALIDTGAECTCVDPSALASLELPVSSGGIITLMGEADGPLPCFTYEVGLTVLHPSNEREQNLVIPALEVEAVRLSHFGIDAVLGRDVLALCVLVYDGPAGAVTLAY